MDVKRQQVGDDQLLFSFEKQASSCPGVGGDGGTGASACEASQACTALDPARALTEHLMEEVCQRDNLKEALKRVRQNKGSPGVDGMTVDELPDHLMAYWPMIRDQLLGGTYQPQPVKRRQGFPGQTPSP